MFLFVFRFVCLFFVSFVWFFVCLFACLFVLPPLKHLAPPQEPIVVEMTDGDEPDGLSVLTNSLTNTGERFLSHQTAVFAAAAAQVKPVLFNSTTSTSRFVKGLAIREIVRSASDEEIRALVRTQPPGTRAKIVHACVSARRHSVLDIVSYFTVFFFVCDFDFENLLFLLFLLFIVCLLAVFDCLLSIFFIFFSCAGDP